MEKLKPCPFCGGRSNMAIFEKDGGYQATVYCMSGAEIGCFATSSHWAARKSWAKESAMKAWNRRA